jgi:hypothetical protein
MDPANVASIPYVVSAAAANFDPATWLVNYGIAGIIIGLLVTGQLRTKAEVAAIQKIADQRLEQIERKDAALAALIEQITRTLPQLGQLATVIDSLPSQVQSHNKETEILAKLDTLQRKLDENERRRPHG